MAAQLAAKDTVITFNWDLLLDNVLGRAQVLSDLTAAPEREQYRAFVRDFTAVGEGTIEKLGLLKPFRQWGAEHGYYLKLHGSIDWVWCNRRACRNEGRAFPVTKYSTRPICGYCLEKMQ